MAFDVVVPVVFLPLTMLLASQGWFWTVGVFTILILSLIVFLFGSFRLKKRNRFFLSWTLTSFIFLLAIFELEVVPYLEILFLENFILMCFVSVMTLCAYFAKLQVPLVLPAFTKNDGMSLRNSEEEWPICDVCRIPKPPRSKHCKLCGFCVLRQDHHCIWLDICVGAKNHRLYFCALIALLLSCCYYANLTLTTVCHPVLFSGLFLLPNDCSDVYGDVHISICYVSAVYVIVIGTGAVLKLILQSWLICHNSTFQEWKYGHTEPHHHQGIITNCAEFWRGYH